MILSVRDVSAGYGSVPVLRNISLAQAEGEVLGVVGHNGMGKTTLLRALMGLVKTESGAIDFDGQRIEVAPAYRRSLLGIGYVPQGNSGFPDLTVREGLATAVKRSRDHDDGRDPGLFPRLRELLSRRAALSGGERRLRRLRELSSAHRACSARRDDRGVQPSSSKIASASDLHQIGMSILIVDQNWLLWPSSLPGFSRMQNGRSSKRRSRQAFRPEIPAALVGRNLYSICLGGADLPRWIMWLDRYRGLLCDLDGCLVLAGRPLPGARNSLPMLEQAVHRLEQLDVAQTVRQARRISAVAGRSLQARHERRRCQRCSYRSKFCRMRLSHIFMAVEHRRIYRSR